MFDSEIKNNCDNENLKSWPFEEARKLQNRKGDVITFETGYGPSGLPHIGTFGENLRTTFVRRAFEYLYPGRKTRLISFSDDMDGLRKVPDNVPNKELLAANLNRPLTSVPDPFGCHQSFGEHNNSKLREFLDQFGFDYQFISSTAMYQSGFFDEALLKILKHHEEILEIMLPSLREERSSTYSPFLPIHPVTNEVMQVAMEKYNVDAGTVVFKDHEGKFVEVPVTGGNCKLQWKVDWAMRWHVLKVDYEMFGKDLIDSAKLSKKICRVLGSEGPETFFYELFLDNDGKKISKSKGNGISLDDWLDFAPKESLANYMFQTPKAAKKLAFNVIPRQVDEYLSNLDRYETNLSKDNPCWHIHHGVVPVKTFDITYNLLINLASAASAENSDIMWGFLEKYFDPNYRRDKMLEELVESSVKYYQKFVKPTKSFRAPTDVESNALKDLFTELDACDDRETAADLQNVVFEVGKKYFEDNLKAWFACIYEVLFGSKEGPKIGSFIKIYGVRKFQDLIASKINL